MVSDLKVLTSVLETWFQNLDLSWFQHLGLKVLDLNLRLEFFVGSLVRYLKILIAKAKPWSVFGAQSQS